MEQQEFGGGPILRTRSQGPIISVYFYNPSEKNSKPIIKFGRLPVLQ